MAKSDDDKPPKAAKAVGYGKPPTSSQFKPGQSGNPKGRPKADPSLSKILKKVLSSRVSLHENGSPRRITVVEALVRVLAAKAMKGDLKASAQVLHLMDRYDINLGREERHEIQIRFVEPDPDKFAAMEEEWKPGLKKSNNSNEPG